MTKHYYDGKPTTHMESTSGRWRVTIGGPSDYCICWTPDMKSYRLVEYVEGDEKLSADALEELCEVRYAIHLIAGDMILEQSNNRGLYIRWPIV